MFFRDSALTFRHLSLDAAALEIARTAITEEDEEAICRAHGFELDRLSDYECYELYHLIDKYERIRR